MRRPISDKRVHPAEPMIPDANYYNIIIIITILIINKGE